MALGIRLHLAAGIILAVVAGHAVYAQVDDVSASSQIAIVSPIDGAKFEAKANVPVTIQGMDVPNVGHVIRQNGMVFRSLVLDPSVPIQTEPVTFDVTFDVDDLRAGRYTFVAMIDDVSSAPVTIIVKRRHAHHR